MTGEWCCNVNDCAEEIGTVSQLPNGNYFIASTGEEIDAKRVIWRSPGSWWRCRYLAGERAGKTRCLIGPPRGS